MRNNGKEDDFVLKKQDAAKLFTKSDRNADGFVTRDEMKQVFNDWTDKDLDDMFKVADKNGDGKVDLSEFIDWVLGHAPPKPMATVQECDHADGFREDLGEYNRPVLVCDTCKKTFPMQAPPEAPAKECEHPDGLREDRDANDKPILVCDTCKRKFPLEALPEVSAQGSMLMGSKVSGKMSMLMGSMISGKRSMLAQECKHPDGFREDVDAYGALVWSCDTCKIKFPREAPPEVSWEECDHPDGFREDVDSNGAPIWSCDLCKRKFPRKVLPEIGTKKQKCDHEDGFREDWGLNGEHFWVCDTCKERFTAV